MRTAAFPNSQVNSLPRPQNVARHLASLLIARIDQVRSGLAAEFRRRFPVDTRLLRLALNEAEAVAWQTEFPHLVFPELAREKAEGIVAWTRGQEERRRRTLTLSLAA